VEDLLIKKIWKMVYQNFHDDFLFLGLSIALKIIATYFKRSLFWIPEKIWNVNAFTRSILAIDL